MLKRISYWLSVAVIGTIAGFSIQFAKAWTEPTLTPPQGDVLAPVTVSASAQVKSGPLGVSGIFHGYSNGYFDGNVGIGTVTPAQKLSVAGVIETTSGGVKFPDGTTQTTAAVGGGGPWTTSGTNIYNSNTGNVGIGTNTPVSKLSVSGGDLQVETGQGRFKGWYTAGSGLGAEIGISANQAYVLSYDRTASAYMPLNVAGSTVMLGRNGANDIFVNASGNVGIGTGAPATKLSVVGNATITGTLSTTGTTGVGYHIVTTTGPQYCYNACSATASCPAGEHVLGGGCPAATGGVAYAPGVLVITGNGGYTCSTPPGSTDFCSFCTAYAMCARIN